MKPTTQQIMDIVHNALSKGSSNSMRDSEIERGYKPIFPGEYPWLSADDWPKDVVVSLDGHRVRIVAIHAINPGNGAFRRLVLGILKAGLVPTVVAPFSEMTEILKRWGWHTQIVGRTFDDREDRWFPTRKWKEQRTKGRRVNDDN